MAETYEYREKLKREIVIAGHFAELFPNYAYSDELTAIDLMRAEILTLRNENRKLAEELECSLITSNLGGFKWYLHRSVDGCLVVLLDSPIGETAATVWIAPTCDGHYTWHTWDRHGVGGENDASPSIPLAMKESEMAVERQGKHAAPRDLICNCGAELDGSHDHLTCGPPAPRN